MYDPEKKEFRFNLNWKQSIIFLILMALILTFSSVYRFKQAAARLKEAARMIKTHITAKKSHYYTSEMRKLDKHGDYRHKKILAANFARETDVQIQSITLGAVPFCQYTLRVEYTSNGQHDDGQKYHYFEVPYDSVTGWDYSEIYQVNDSRFKYSIMKAEYRPPRKD